jgi:hypothetical protein
MQITNMNACKYAQLRKPCAQGNKGTGLERMRAPTCCIDLAADTRRAKTAHYANRYVIIAQVTMASDASTGVEEP